MAIFLVAACSTAPYTGRRQVILVSEGEEAALGDEAYSHVLRDSVTTHQPEAERIVRKVGERIAQVADKPQVRKPWAVIESALTSGVNPDK